MKGQYLLQYLYGWFCRASLRGAQYRGQDRYGLLKTVSSPLTSTSVKAKPYGFY